MSVEVASLQAVFGADTSGFMGGAGQVESRLGSIGSKVQSAGAKVSGFGRALVSGFGPAAAIMTSALWAAANFDEQIHNIGAAAQLTSAETDALSASLLKMGAANIYGPQKLAEAYYEIAGGVVDVSQRMPILEAAIATAEAGNANLTGTTSALITIMNSYGAENISAAHASDILTRAVGMGVGSMDEFAAAMPQVAGLAASLGVSFDEVGADLSYLTTKGYSASESANMLQGMMVALIRPNADMQAALVAAGYATGQAAIETLGLAGTYQMLADAGADIPAITGRVEALQGATALLADDTDAYYASFYGGVEGANWAAQQEQMKSFTYQFKLFKSQVQAGAIIVGNALAPALAKASPYVIKIARAFADFAAAHPKTIAVIGGLVIGLTAVGAVMVVLGPIIGGVGLALGFILSPIGLIIAALVGLGIAYKTNFLGFGDAVRSVAGWLKDAVGVAADFVGGLVDAFKAGGLEGVGSYILDAIGAGLTDLATWAGVHIGAPIIASISGLTWGDVKGAGTAILGAIGMGFGDFIMWGYTHIVQPIGVALTTADWSAIAATGLNILIGILRGIGDLSVWVNANITQPLITWLIGAVGSVATAAASIGAGIVSGIAGALSDLPGIVIGAINDAIPNDLSFDLGKLGSYSIDIPDNPIPIPGRAGGGPVSAGMPYWVGENKEPELFVPGQSGRIYNQRQLAGAGGGGGGQPITITGPIYVMGVQNIKSLYDELRDEANSRSPGVR